MNQYIAWLHELGMADIDRVGGKNASLGEMISHLTKLGVSVPGGFATTAFAFQEFLSQSGLQEKISAELSTLDIEDIQALATSGQRIRHWIMDTPFQAPLQQAVSEAWQMLSSSHGSEPAVAVRSTARRWPCREH